MQPARRRARSRLSSAAATCSASPARAKQPPRRRPKSRGRGRQAAAAGQHRAPRSAVPTRAAAGVEALNARRQTASAAAVARGSKPHRERVTTWYDGIQWRADGSSVQLGLGRRNQARAGLAQAKPPRPSQRPRHRSEGPQAQAAAPEEASHVTTHGGLTRLTRDQGVAVVTTSSSAAGSPAPLSLHRGTTVMTMTTMMIMMTTLRHSRRLLLTHPTTTEAATRTMTAGRGTKIARGIGHADIITSRAATQSTMVLVAPEAQVIRIITSRNRDTAMAATRAMSATAAGAPLMERCAWTTA